ncbi:MAG TPA: DEAD/DEAH box helicase, partial [Candidatus Sutterella merdavium]|nr:DEAD/DEAH box helicase [Candidatus Sutterella merdavium]
MSFVLRRPNPDSGPVVADGSASLRVVAFDLEINPETGECLDMGAVDSDGGRVHGCVAARFRAFLEGADVAGGHNVVDCDMRGCPSLFDGLKAPIFDTLRLETLLRPLSRRHALPKEAPADPGTRSNPLADAETSFRLLIDLVDDWRKLPEDVRRILVELLSDVPGFAGFFRLLGLKPEGLANPAAEIRRVFAGKLCTSAPIEEFVERHPVELGCVLGFIAVSETEHSAFPATPLWLSHRYLETDRIVEVLRGRFCRDPECEYCRRRSNLTTALKEYFGFDGFRVYEGDKESLQEAAAASAVAGESLLAIFPTGGGKSITFQLPALMAARATAGLTVVLSPLQSLMKDQVDNLEKKEIFAAVTINGLVNLLERKAAFEEIESGRASLLYISPEALRSPSIVRALEKRRVERFVIDEAHCFSAWGHDFRVDYLYIGEFLKEFQERVGRRIPVSCF